MIRWYGGRTGLVRRGQDALTEADGVHLQEYQVHEPFLSSMAHPGPKEQH